MYIPTPTHQTYVFLMCIGFGFLLGILYHVVRFIRKTFLPFKRAVLILDIIYCIVSTFLAFCFLLCCNDGELRFFIFCGFGLGLSIYYLTFGTFVSKFSDRCTFRLRTIFRPFKRFFGVLGAKMKKLTKNFKKTAK